MTSIIVQFLIVTITRRCSDLHYLMIAIAISESLGLVIILKGIYTPGMKFRG